jgi:PAS domain-containing protein
MSPRHAQRRAAKAARRKKLLAERRKIAMAEKQLPQVERMRRMAAGAIHCCLVNEALFEIGNGTLILARRTADGRMALAAFMLDVYCVGVKDVILRLGDARETESIVAAFGTVQPLIAIDPAHARKLLRELVAWSLSIGLPPHPDYARAELLFGDVAADACAESFSFGVNGKPLLIPGPAETPARIRQWIDALRRKLGDDGFVLANEVDNDEILDDGEGVDVDDAFEAEADDAVESALGMGYDPNVAPDTARWLELDEGDRILLAEAYHRRARIEVPDGKVHAIIHVVVENQVALGDELPVRRAIDRLMSEGLDRHDAVHAVGSVLAAYLNDLLKADAPPDSLEAYKKDVERLTVESWRAAFGPGPDDERP